ncbi:MAG: type VI secretion system baseplate subunit TssF [Methylobacteriaceae bacterium]|nr:type VI secretion system baseplate subunit TssF [Methylobacteriaceae bacterium]
MHREFLDLYNRELKLLYEQAKEFAEEYPGIAERLGGLVGEQADPMIAGLLEGAAFLAARVQLKIKHEFPEFTANLLEQLVPNYLAPTPSVILAQIAPGFGDAALREGRLIPRQSCLDARFRERDAQVACRFRMTAPVTLWPFEISGADYIGTLGALQALRLPAPPRAMAGLRISLLHRSTARREDEQNDAETEKRPDLHFAGCRADELTVHLGGPESDAVAIYEQIFGHCVGVYFRYLDAFGDPVIVPAEPDCIEQVGFSEDEALFPNDDRIFTGFDLLREYFMFPRKFLGFRLTRLRRALARLPTRRVEIVFIFDEVNARLAAAVTPQAFLLYAAPAINLFEMTTDRIPVRDNQHEYHVVPDRSRTLDFEAHRVLELTAHYRGGAQKQRVYPLYSAANGGRLADTDLCYTLRRLPRRRTTNEKRVGVASNYTGTDMFISLVEPATIDSDHAVAELGVRALCSNRHLTEHLPVGQGGADFRLVDDMQLDVFCAFGPTPPREPIVTQLRSRSEHAHTGVVAWRLINMLSLNHLGLVERGAGENAQSIREILSMFADLTDSATERRIRGVRSVSATTVVRRVRQKSGVGAARGFEITVTLDEKAFEGAGVFLLGAVLDRFYREYAAVNHFTQTVIRSSERGEVMRWPVRYGARRPL